MSRVYDALNIKPGFDKDDYWLQETNPSKAVLPNPTRPLSL